MQNLSIVDKVVHNIPRRVLGRWCKNVADVTAKKIILGQIKTCYCANLRNSCLWRSQDQIAGKVFRQPIGRAIVEVVRNEPEIKRFIEEVRTKTVRTHRWALRSNLKIAAVAKSWNRWNLIKKKFTSKF